MENQEKIAQIEQAMELIIEAQNIIDEVVSGTNLQGNYEAYGKYGFSQLLGNGNPYDNSLNTIIENLEEE